MTKLKLNTSILIIFFLALYSCSNDDLEPTNDLYIHIPDNNFEGKLIEQGIDTDGLINEKMLRKDAEKATYLDLNVATEFERIDDLSGIEGFVNLKFLSSANQNIESVDLSKNVSLDTLYLLGNSISSIDLSHNRNLIFIDIQSNNLNSIDGLANLDYLKDLDLSWNNFEEFSIHNESLEILHFSHNNLVSLDTDGAINLEHIFMPSNQLESVDFSTNSSLETLLISGNNIENIGLENNVKLTHLYITSNSLTYLDVSNNMMLEDLRVFDNPELSCIKIGTVQNIPMVSKSDSHELNSDCD
ncbi:hypothetical protein [Urechidicola vernalis]|uniref:Leucine-rich repeat domain-containing protein n=1 Tax=Urechidicola vernalis TaxID=3075600 RepID=A0ABU2Y0E7_9FLAO|nr:hypothetical protein [Urechidicola sp. P050]MDT0551613.1 hypothetical protein [Urechidicola sp. P050]